MVHRLANRRWMALASLTSSVAEAADNALRALSGETNLLTQWRF